MRVSIMKPRESFDWLKDPQIRHGGLRMIQSTIARGRLNAPEFTERRARLVEGLTELMRDPATSNRDAVAIAGLLIRTMGNADRRLLEAELRSIRKPAKPRRRRMR
jgi:hypothetical protein